MNKRTGKMTQTAVVIRIFTDNRELRLRTRNTPTAISTNAKITPTNTGKDSTKDLVDSKIIVFSPSKKIPSTTQVIPPTDFRSEMPGVCDRVFIFGIL